MERRLDSVPSGFGRHFGIALALTIGVAACGGEEDCSVTDSCPNQAPSATITAPADGATTVVGQSVTFEGSATDPEEGPITGEALIWTSDLDGPIGTGESFSRSDLSGGIHQIALSASDGEGAVGETSISFGVGGAPLIEITAPVDQPSGAPQTVTSGTQLAFSADVEDVEDGSLSGGDLVWTSNVDGQIGTGSSFQRNELSPGMHTVTLTATDSDGNEAKATVLVIVKPPAAPGYQIHIRWSEGVELTPAQQTAVEDAVDRLESIITGDVGDIPSMVLDSPSGICGGAAIPTMEESVDDVIIYLEFVPIDGPLGTVASAGPCLIRSSADAPLSVVGGMRIDTDDLQELETRELMDDIVLHEMMHVLGFGTLWEHPLLDFLEQPSNPNHPEYDPMNTDTHFTGPEALARFDSIGGATYTGGEVVPVENDTLEFKTGSLDGHWRESVFDNEMMTPAANATNPLSELTVAQFDDLGYTVDYDAADPYVQVFSVVLEPHADVPVIDLSGDIWRGELHEVDPDGSFRRIR